MFDLANIEKLFETEKESDAYRTIGKLDRLLVAHASFADAWSGVNGCIMASTFSREAANCMLLGNGGAGKTSLAMRMVNSMPPLIIKDNNLEISTVPAFYTSFKSTKTLDALTSDILKKLGDFNPNSGRLGDKAARVLKQLKMCRTKIIFIDELHDLDDFENNAHKLIKWVKEITNECGPVVCLMGLERCKTIFDGDTEMSRRFKRKFILRPLTVGTKEEPGHLPGFMTAICRAIVSATTIRSFPALNAYENALKIWSSTGGSPDYIMTLLKEGVLRALLANRHEVTMEDFSNVWDGGVLDATSIVKFNPFRASLTQLITGIRKVQAL